MDRLRACSILNVSPKATLDEIKTAYRKKAIQFHPDKSGNTETTSLFIEVTQAYIFLIDSNSKKVNQKFQEDVKDNYNPEALARMSYQDFVKSKLYRESQAVNDIIVHLFFVFSLILFLLPLWGYLLASQFGFYVGIGLWVFSTPFWGSIIVNYKALNLSSFLNSIGVVVRMPILYKILSVLIYLLFFTLVTMNTLISMSFLMFIYLLPLVLLVVPSHVLFLQRGWLLVILYGLISVMFLLNYWTSGETHDETFSFFHEDVEQYRSKSGRIGTYETSFITLKGDQYLEYPQIRIFADYTEMAGKNVITYSIADGGIKWKVVKRVRFEKKVEN